jgi:hypothetical protein
MSLNNSTLAGKHLPLEIQLVHAPPDSAPGTPVRLSTSNCVFAKGLWLICRLNRRTTFNISLIILSNIHIREVRVIYPSFLHVCSGVRELWYVLEKLTPKRLDVKSTAQICPQCIGKVMCRVFGGVHCLFPKVLPQTKPENELCPNQLQTNHYDTLQTKLFSNSNFKL